MWLQHVIANKVQITFIRSFPQNTAGKLTLVALNMLCEVLSRSIEALVCQGVLGGWLFLTSGNTQQASRRTQHKLGCYSVCFYAYCVFVDIWIKAHLAHPVFSVAAGTLVLNYLLLLEHTYGLCFLICFVGHNNLILYI